MGASPKAAVRHRRERGAGRCLRRPAIPTVARTPMSSARGSTRATSRRAAARMWIIDFAHDGRMKRPLYEVPFEYVRSASSQLARGIKRATYRETVVAACATAPGNAHGAARQSRASLPLHGLEAPPLRLGRSPDVCLTISSSSSRATMTTSSASSTPRSTSCGRADRERSFARRRAASATRRPPASRPSRSRGRRGRSPSTIRASRPSPPPRKDLVEKRDRWLNPEGASEAELKKRTLTNLYNQRPTWLDLAHKRLDDAVLDAYGWPHDLTDDQILERLLALNLERAGASMKEV